VISVTDSQLATDSLPAFDLQVVNTNDPPTISGSPDTTVDEDSFYSFAPSASDPDVGDTLTFSIVNQPTWSAFSTTTGVLSGTPTNADVGTTTGIIIGVSDGAVADSLAAFDLQVVNTNDPPTISGTPDTIVDEDSFYSFAPSASDPDVGDTLTFSIVNQPTWSAFSTSTGVLSGTPANADVGTTTGIIIGVSDGALGHVLPPFDLQVVNTNDPPTISGTPGTTVNEDSFYSFAPSASDSDVGDTLTFSIVNQPTWAAFSTTTGTLSGTPDNADVGTTTGIVISVTDSQLATDSLPAFDLQVVNVNDAPVASAETYSTDEDVVLSVTAPGVLGNDSDAEGDPLSAVLDTDVTNGTLTLSADGSFSYTPTLDFNGADTFTYHANDGAANSNTVTVILTVNPVNDPPVAVTDSATVDEGGTVTTLDSTDTSVLDNDTDVDSGSLTAILVAGPVQAAGFTLNLDGTFTYTHDDSDTLADSFTYKANDGTDDSNTVAVNIVINPIDDTSSGGGGGGCFIATAAWGYDHWRTDRLRDVRDAWLITNAPGRWLVDQYYTYSPEPASWVAKHPRVKRVVSFLLERLFWPFIL
jgi:VCBS repeat-containing protein